MNKRIKRESGGSRLKNAGFTLLELLIALLMLSLIILIIGGAMRLGLRSVEKGEREVEELERLRSVILLLDGQIASAIPTTWNVDGEDVVSFKGDEKQCSFISSSSLWGRKDAFMEVSYSIENRGGSLMVLETERLPGEEGGVETVLLEELEEAVFAYLWRDDFGSSSWTEQWEEKDSYPEAVAIHVKSKRFEHNLIFPFMAYGPSLDQVKSEQEGLF
jgi:general secretion pathway protein J